MNKTKAMLLEEIDELREKVKKLEKYEQYQDAADEVAVVRESFVNAGFSNEEAFQLTMEMLRSVCAVTFRR